MGNMIFGTVAVLGLGYWYYCTNKLHTMNVKSNMALPAGLPLWITSKEAGPYMEKLAANWGPMGRFKYVGKLPGGHFISKETDKGPNYLVTPQHT